MCLLPSKLTKLLALCSEETWATGFLRLSSKQFMFQQIPYVCKQCLKNIFSLNLSQTFWLYNNILLTIMPCLPRTWRIDHFKAHKNSSDIFKHFNIKAFQLLPSFWQTQSNNCFVLNNFKELSHQCNVQINFNQSQNLDK